MKTAIYPGTFDPITNGHLDIIKRAASLFDKVIVGVTTNPSKSTLFTIEQRVKMIQDVVEGLKQVEVESFDDLLVNYALQRNASAIIRGLRAISDFEFEFQMALFNRKLSNKLVTVFLMPHEKYTYLNSKIVKEVASFQGDVSCFVPPNVEQRLKEKFKK
ncbi:MAG: pantetheine-phosphate adenylyltransferase [bacterium]|nr:pantetheine-phosphate adenylyltransferase [bacterium]